MVGRKRKVTEIVSAVGKLVASKATTENRTHLGAKNKKLAEDLEVQEGRVLELEEEVKLLKESLEVSKEELGQCKDQVAKLETEKEKLKQELVEVKSRINAEKDNAEGNNNVMNLTDNEEDESSISSQATHKQQNAAKKNSNSRQETFLDEDLESEDLSAGEDAASNFRPEANVMSDIHEKVAIEVERITRIREHQIAKKKMPKPIPQNYTINKFVNDIMNAGFTEQYMRNTKLSNQSSKRGASSERKQMHYSDRNKLLRISIKAWSGLPNITRPEIVRLTKKAITWKLGNEYKKNTKGDYK